MIPQFTFAVEHYNRICRIIEKGLPVRLALELKTTYLEEDLHDYNLIADIKGSDPKIGDEVVMLGAHIDSWHAGTGCTDNGAGSAVMLEAMRLVRVLMAETGVSPRRTIRNASLVSVNPASVNSANLVRSRDCNSELWKASP